MTEKPRFYLRRAVSVWSATGAPMLEGSIRGASRSKLFLLTLTATEDEVIRAFTRSCQEADQLNYIGAKMEQFLYVGWAWIPEEEEGITTHVDVPTDEATSK